MKKAKIVCTIAGCCALAVGIWKLGQEIEKFRKIKKIDRIVAKIDDDAIKEKIQGYLSDQRAAADKRAPHGFGQKLCACVKIILA